MSTYSYQYISTVDLLHERQILNKELNVTNEESSLLDMFEYNLLGDMVQTSQPLYSNFVNPELFALATISGSVTDNSGGSGQGDITFPLTLTGGASFPRVGDVVTFLSGFQGIVTAKTSGSPDTITVKAIKATVTTANLAAASGQVIAVTGSAFGEGTTGPTPRRYAPTKYDNQTQIIKEGYTITDVEAASTLEVDHNGKRYQIYFAQHRHLMAFRKYIDFTLLFQQGSAANFASASPTLGTAGQGIQTTSGMREQIDTYGSNTASATIGVALFNAQEKALSKLRAPKEYAVLLGAEGDIAWTNFFSAVGASPEMENARFSVDGQALNFDVQKVTWNGRTYYKKRLQAFDEPYQINYTGSPGWQKDIYMLPMGNVSASDGQMVPRIRCRWMPVFGKKFHETNTGKGAPTPTSNEAVWNIEYQSNMGLEMLDAGKNVKWTLA